MAELDKQKLKNKVEPSDIEEKRRLRKLKKEQTKKEQTKASEDERQFIVRDFLEIPGRSNNALHMRIMTYNVLAQALIRRDLFPTSGEALKWNKRSLVLISEIKHYDADIICLQELDVAQYKTFWNREFDTLGFDTKFFHFPTKRHGVLIAYRREMFVCRHQSFIDYDKEITGDVQSSAATQNVGLLVNLDFTDQIKAKYSLKRDSVVVGTTHLFWHPFGSFERTRQTYVVLNKVKNFCETLASVTNNTKGYYCFFAGDFNSQPFDAPYLSIVSKPVRFDDRASRVLGCSLEYLKSEDERLSLPEADYTPSEGQIHMMQNLQKIHNDLDMRAISLYSVAYGFIHPENSGKDNDRNEPIFSNWAHTWRGLLDYIFLITPWSINEDHTEVDTLKQIESHDLKITKLLKLPLPEEMGSEPSGQPRTGQYPSDHLCLMAEVELL